MIAEIFKIDNYNCWGYFTSISLGLVKYPDNMIDTVNDRPKLNNLGWKYTEEVLEISKESITKSYPDFIIKLGADVIKPMFKIKKDKYEQFFK